jgi:YihY family inner membrane protein
MDERRMIFRPVVDFLKVHTGVGIAATIVVIWSALGFIKILTHASSRAWNEKVYGWLQLPLKSFGMLLIMIVVGLVGMAVPSVSRLVSPGFFKAHTLLFQIYKVAAIIIPFFVMFFGISILYKIAPRRQVKYADVGLPALFITILLSLCQALFLFYLNSLTGFTVAYGVVGGIMTLMFWIYISGYILIFGVCICAAGSEIKVTNETGSGIKI